MGAERADLFAGPRVPDLHGCVLSSRDQVSAVGTVRHGEELRPARDLREREDFLSGLCVPDLDGKQSTIPAGGGEPLAVGLPDHAEDDFAVAGEFDAAPASLRVPDLGGHPAGRSNLLAVGADRQAPDFVAFLQGQSFMALITLGRSRVPDADGSILAGRDQALAVRAERQASTHAGVSAEAEHLPAALRVPEVHRLVLAGRGEAPAVRTEGDAQNESAMRKPVEELAGRRIPHVHAAVEAGRGQPPAVLVE